MKKEIYCGGYYQRLGVQIFDLGTSGKSLPVFQVRELFEVPPERICLREYTEEANSLFFKLT